MSSATKIGQTYSLETFSNTANAKSCWTTEEMDQLKKAEQKRKDGRTLDDTRPIFLTADTSSSADGSAYAELGNTKLYCVVNGPHEISKADTAVDSNRRAVLTAKVNYAPFAFRSRFKRQRDSDEIPEEKALSSALVDAFTPAIFLEKYPRSQIDLLITVIEDDGGVLPLTLMACSIALTTAGIEICDVIVAANLMVVADCFVIDPTSSERSQTHSDDASNTDEIADITIGLMPSLNQVVCVNQHGHLKSRNFTQAMKLLADCCYRIYPVVQESISKSIRRERKIISSQRPTT